MAGNKPVTSAKIRIASQRIDDRLDVIHKIRMARGTETCKKRFAHARGKLVTQRDGQCDKEQDKKRLFPGSFVSNNP